MKEIGKTRNDSKDSQNSSKTTSSDIMRKYINGKLNGENSKSDNHSIEKIISNDFHEWIDRVTMDAFTALKKMDVDNSIKELVGICQSSFLKELEEKHSSIIAKIKEKELEIAMIDTEIKKAKDSEESTSNLELKQIELDGKKNFIQGEKWMLEKEKDIPTKEISILMEAQMHCNDLVELLKMPEKPEASSLPTVSEMMKRIRDQNRERPLVKLGSLSREFRFLQEMHREMLQEHQGMLQEHQKILQEQKDALQMRKEVQQKLNDTQHKLESTSLGLYSPTEAERAHLERSQKVLQEHLEVLQGQNNTLQKRQEILQKTYEIEDKMKNTLLQETERTYLKQAYRNLQEQQGVLQEQQKVLQEHQDVLQEHQKALQEMYTIEHELESANFLEVERASLQQIYQNSQKHQDFIQKLQEDQEFLQKQSNTLQKRQKVQEKLHDTQVELRLDNLSAVDRVRLERSHEVLQKHSEILQKLYDTGHELRRSDLSEADRAHLERSRKVLQEHSKILQKSYDTQVKLRLDNLSEGDRTRLERSCEVLQKHSEVLQKLQDTQHNLACPDLSQAQRAYLEKSRSLQREHLSWLDKWNKVLVQQREPNLSQAEHERLEIQGSIYKEAGEFLEKRQQLLDYKQTCSDLSEREQAILSRIESEQSQHLKHLEYALSRESNDEMRSHWKNEEIRGVFGKRYKRYRAKELLKVLEKYFKIRDKLQQTQAELSRPNLSQAEHAKLETSCRILKSWQKNLEKYAKDCPEDLKEECQTLEKLYNKWERGTLSISSQVTHPKLFWKNLLS